MALSNDEIQNWARALGDSYAIEHGAEFVQQYGRLPQSLQEWDAWKAQKQAAGGAAGATGGSWLNNGGADYEYFNQAAEALKLQAAQMAYDEAYRKAQMDLQQAQFAHLSDMDKQRLALDAAKQASDIAINQADLGLRQQAQTQNFSLGVANLIASLRGPSNAFKQQEVMSGLNSMGLSRSLDALKGVYTPPSFQAPQGQPEPASVQTMLRDYASAGGQPYAVSGMNYGTGAGMAATAAPQALTTPSSLQQGGGWTPGQAQVIPEAMGPATQAPSSGGFTAPAPTLQQWGTTPSASLTQAYQQNMPSPTKTVWRNFYKQPGDTQAFDLALWESQGYSPNDVLDTSKAQLPGFTAPKWAQVA